MVTFSYAIEYKPKSEPMYIEHHNLVISDARVATGVRPPKKASEAFPGGFTMLSDGSSLWIVSSDEAGQWLLRH